MTRRWIIIPVKRFGLCTPFALELSKGRIVSRDFTEVIPPKSPCARFVNCAPLNQVIRTKGEVSWVAAVEGIT